MAKKFYFVKASGCRQQPMGVQKTPEAAPPDVCRRSHRAAAYQDSPIGPGRSWEEQILPRDIQAFFVASTGFRFHLRAAGVSGRQPSWRKGKTGVPPLMNIFGKALTGFAVAVMLLLPALIRAATNQVEERVEQPVREAIEIQQATQKGQVQWREERRQMVAAYEQLQQEQARLEAQRQDLEARVVAARARVGVKQARIEAIAQITGQVAPFLDELYRRLALRIDNDLPFLPDERRQRLANLRILLDDPGVAISEKFRKVFEALLVEAEYGNTIEVYQESITIDGQSVLANIFRLGRIGLYYQSLDQQACGFFNVSAAAWAAAGQGRQPHRSSRYRHRGQAAARGDPEPAAGKDRRAMNVFGPLICALVMVVFSPAAPVHGQDMRQIQVQARAARQALAEKAEAEKRAANAAAAESRAKIVADRQSLKEAMQSSEAEKRKLDEAVRRLTAEAKALAEQEQELDRHLSETDAMVGELVGVVRIDAKDIDALTSQSLQTAFIDTDTAFLDAIAGQSRFPDMDAVRRMAALLEATIESSAEVSVRRGAIVDRAGRPAEAEILAIGNFTAAYRIDGEVGYLTYAPAGRQLYALSRLPSARIQRQIAEYMDGKSASVPMDVSRGGALRQLTHALSLWQQIPKGGPIVWPIVAIFALGVLIVIERVVFLLRRRLDADGLVNRIDRLAGQGRWDDCVAACTLVAGKPVARVIKAGLSCCHMQREELENALQEAILREIPAMERFLSTLGLLAAIAPLLGLLGTVTGMIDTFHVITQYGTGDPRMMSGGISEALVTTMLGLCVAIPIMMVHTLLSQTVENRIGQMEEKAVALVNIVDRHRSHIDCADPK